MMRYNSVPKLARPALRLAMGTSLGATIMATITATITTMGAAHATDGYFLNAIGPKAKGMAGVGIALPQDALSQVTNPATGTALGHRADGSIELFFPDRGARIVGNAIAPDAEYDGNGREIFVLPEIGYVRQLSDRIAVGVALNGNGGINTSYEDRNPYERFGAQGEAGVDLIQAFISPSISFEFAEGHSVGISPILLIQAFEAKGLGPFAAFSQDPENFTDNDQSFSVGGGVRVGYYGQLSDRVGVGAFYQSKIRAEAFGEYAGLFADGGDFDVPPSYGLGVSVRPTEALTVGLDVKRIEFSEVGSVGDPIAPLFRGVPFGADNGPGFGWDDINVVKVGGAYRFTPALEVRTGYAWAGNPVEANQTFLNILAPGVTQDHFTVGATYTFSSGLEVSTFALRALEEEVAGKNSIPAMFGGGEADVFLSETSFGVGLGKAF